MGAADVLIVCLALLGLVVAAICIRLDREDAARFRRMMREADRLIAADKERKAREIIVSPAIVPPPIDYR